MEMFPLSCPGGSACFVSHGVESEGECEGEDGEWRATCPGHEVHFLFLFSSLCCALLCSALVLACALP